MGSSPGFGSTARDHVALFTLAFASAPPVGLTKPRTVTRGLIMQKASRHPGTSPGLRHLVSTRFQVLFHSPPGVLFTFPSRYLFAIGHRVVFSLGRWASRIRAGFHVSRRTWDTFRAGLDFAYGAVTPSGGPFQSLPLSSPIPCEGPATLRRKRRSLDCSPFARHY